MTQNQKSARKSVWIVTAGVVMVVVVIGVLIAKVLMDNEGEPRRRSIQTVTLIKPPPPPKIEEKPPEPKVEKKEEIIETTPEPTPEEKPNDAPEDPAPAGDTLGVDAEGGAGSDGFGLVGRKGGRSLLAGSGDRTLMQRYGWYTKLLQEEIRKKVNEHMSKNGGIPDGDLKALIKIELDGNGRVIDFKVDQPSGDQRMDQALKQTMMAVKIDETPPEGMPKTIKLRISSRG